MSDVKREIADIIYDLEMSAEEKVDAILNRFCVVEHKMSRHVPFFAEPELVSNRKKRVWEQCKYCGRKQEERCR